MMAQARLVLALALVFTVAIVGVLRAVQAADGDLDPTFGGDGRVTTDFPGTGEQGRAIAIQKNSKSVVAGYAVSGEVARDFAVVRYNTNGSLDTTFDDDGRVTIDFGSGSDDGAEAVAIQADGKIVVAGFASPDGRTFALARLNTDGSLDDGTAGDSTPGDEFGEGGKVITFITSSATIYDLAIQEDGKIIAAGSAGIPNSPSDVVRATAATGLDFVIARYNTDGSLDDGTAGDSTPGDEFGTDGLAITSFTPDSDDEAFGVIIQENGKIVAAGRSVDVETSPAASSLAPTGNDFALARYNTDGSLDDGTAGDSTPGDEFGVDGLVTTDFFGGDDQAQDVKLQSDGKIVAGGFAFNPDTVPSPSYDFAAARYNTDGSLDGSAPTLSSAAAVTTFGGDGKVTTDFDGTPDQAYGLAIQSDGKIVLAGATSAKFTSEAITLTAITNDFALVRYNADGSLDDGTGGDTTPGGEFGTDGKVTTDFFEGDDQAQDVALQTNNKIVAAGFARDPEFNYQFAAARYRNEIPATDLSVQVTDAPDPVLASKNVTYTIRVKNNGPVNATNVILVNRLPTSSIFISAIPSQGTCTNNDDPPITCNLGNLAAGVTAIVKIKIQTLNIHNVIFNTSTVSADQADSNPSNNEEIEKTTVLRARKLSFSPATLTGGCQNSVGTLLLTTPAPPSGLTFKLSDDSPAVDVPSTFVVPGDQLSATFPVTTHMVSSLTIVTVTAKDGDNLITGRLRILPVTVSSLSITPNTVHGGNNTTGKVSLVCAPDQDLLVRLVSDKGVAQPAQSEIIIPAGQTMGQFTINTEPVSEPRDVTFTAVANGVSKQAVLHVIP